MKRENEEIKQLKIALKNAKAVARQAKASLTAAEKTEQQAEAIVHAIEQSIVAIATRPVEVPQEAAAPAPQKKTAKPGRPKGSTAAKKTASPKKATTGRRGRPPKVVKTGDDLTRVTGVGDKVAEMLVANGVGTFRAMASLSVEQFKDLLRANNMSKFRNPTKWAAQAAVLADKAATEEQVEAPASAPEQAPKKGAKPAAKKSTAKAPQKPVARRGRPPKAKANAEAEAEVKVEDTKPAPAAKPAKAKKAPAKPTGRRARHTKAKATSGSGDDLTRVKGVGDKVAEMLQQNGVNTFEAMAALSVEDYKELLRANNMSKFRNPTKWASQADALAKAND